MRQSVNLSRPAVSEEGEWVEVRGLVLLMPMCAWETLNTEANACIDVRKQGVNKLCMRQKTDALKEKEKKKKSKQRIHS